MKEKSKIVNLTIIKLSKRAVKIKPQKNGQSNINANWNKKTRTTSYKRSSGSVEIKEKLGSQF